MEADYRQLMYLLAIAEHGSFSRAAAKLRMSQPALSNSVAALERRLDAKLLTRGRSGAALTDAGRVLVRHATILQGARLFTLSLHPASPIIRRILVLMSIFR